MADFNKTIEQIHRYEGDGEVNDPNDYGGQTKCGIAKRYHPDIDISKLTWQSPTPEGMISCLPIYRNDYWNKIGGDAIADQMLADSMMDIAVNISWKEAVRWAQHAHNELIASRDPDTPDTLTEDGLMGPKTIAALNRYPKPSEITKMLEGFQFSYYMRRISEDETQRAHLRSWLARVELRQAK